MGCQSVSRDASFKASNELWKRDQIKTLELLENIQSEALFDTDAEALEELIKEQDSIVGIFDDAIGRRRPDNVVYLN